MFSYTLRFVITSTLLLGLAAVMTRAQDWSTAHEIVTGLHSEGISSYDIGIAVTSDGVWHVVWSDVVESDTATTFYILHASSLSEDTILARGTYYLDAHSGETVAGPSIAVGLDGTLHVAYRLREIVDGDNTNNSILYMNNVPGSWSPPQEIVTGLNSEGISSYDISIAVGPDGAWHLVYSDIVENGHVGTSDILYANSMMEQSTLALGTYDQDTHSGDVVAGPSIAIGPDGALHVAYRLREIVDWDNINNPILYMNNQAGSWSTPQEIVTGLNSEGISSYDISIAISPDGVWHLVYSDIVESSPLSVSNIFYVNSMSEVTVLAHGSLDQDAHGGDVVAGPSVAAHPDGSCHVAYRLRQIADWDNFNNPILYKRRVSPFPDALVLEPDPVLAIMTNAIDPQSGTIYIGDHFDDTYDAADINPSSLLINGTIPATGTVLTTHPLLEGEALAVSFPLGEFAAGYELIWDTTIQVYTVTGEFDDASPFSAGDEFFYLGRVSGDLTLDGRVDISDVVLMVEWYFGGGPPPVVVETADVNASGDTDISDLLYLVDYVFNMGPAPQHP